MAFLVHNVNRVMLLTTAPSMDGLLLELVAQNVKQENDDDTRENASRDCLHGLLRDDWAEVGSMKDFQAYFIIGLLAFIVSNTSENEIVRLISSGFGVGSMCLAGHHLGRKF